MYLFLMLHILFASNPRTFNDDGKASEGHIAAYTYDSQFVIAFSCIGQFI